MISAHPSMRRLIRTSVCVHGTDVVDHVGVGHGQIDHHNEEVSESNKIYKQCSTL